MSQKTTLRTVSTAFAASTVVLLLAGCVGETGSAPATSAPLASPSGTTATSSAPASPSADGVSESEAVSLVEDYLTAFQEERFADAYTLLSEGAQSIAGPAERFADTAVGGFVRVDDATGYLGTDGVITAGPGPVDDAVLVTAVRYRHADAWIVRDTPEGPRIDDAGVPLTGQSPYEWVNPASGPEDIRDVTPVDPTAPAAIVFADRGDGAEDGASLVGNPDELVAYIGTTEVTASAAASESQRRWEIALDTVAPSADVQPLTVAWRVSDDLDVWRTSTTPLYTG